MDFHNKKDLKKVHDGRPWGFGRYMFCITSFNRNIVPQNLPFNNELIWVQLHQLVLGMMNCKYGEFMGEVLGEVKELDIDEDGVGWVLSYRLGYGSIFLSLF